jgi:hypothetical protein
VLVDGFDELLRRHLNAEVDDVKACAFEHDVDQVLTDFVDVALHGAHEERADGLDTSRDHQRAQHLEGARHGASRNEHLGDEEVTALEASADLLQRGNQRVEKEYLGGESHGETRVRELEDHGGVAQECGVV